LHLKFHLFSEYKESPDGSQNAKALKRKSDEDLLYYQVSLNVVPDI
jgi:hypothetical protein